MKRKNTLALMGAGALFLASSAANALLILDGTELDTTNVGASFDSTQTTDIGRYELTSGSATVEQELNAGGTPFVGAEFNEFGAIYSIAYVAENGVGNTDVGAPQLFPDVGGQLLQLDFAFSGLKGVVTAYDAGTGEIKYNFTPGVGSLTLTGTDNDGDTAQLATFDIVAPSGGDLSDFFSAAGANGDSTITTQVATATADLFQDNAGNSLVANLVDNPLYMIFTTNNVIPSNNPPTIGKCTFADSGTQPCATITPISSAGQAVLAIPAPNAIALLALGMLALGGTVRARRKS